MYIFPTVWIYINHLLWYSILYTIILLYGNIKKVKLYNNSYRGIVWVTLYSILYSIVYNHLLELEQFLWSIRMEWVYLYWERIVFFIVTLMFCIVFSICDKRRCLNCIEVVVIVYTIILILFSVPFVFLK